MFGVATGSLQSGIIARCPVLGPPPPAEQKGGEAGCLSGPLTTLTQGLVPNMTRGRYIFVGRA